ncbi:MAG: hypothetical protein HY293_01740, partial [Planctomycetes bacterium]|nr:hypothetical protein [Planctomycetota bacterium]
MRLRRSAIRLMALLAASLLVPACLSSRINPPAPSLLTAVAFPPAAPAGQWTWQAGSKFGNQPGLYGTRGVPDAANAPGARMQPAYSTDAFGGFWLFGGRSYDESGAFGESNDLWRWNGSAWAWVKGSKLKDSLGVYGTQGTAADTNLPGSRDTMAFATDASGRLWIYGGIGFGETSLGELSDLWRFDGTNWVWLSGTKDPGPLPVHGTQGVPAAANTPGGREQSLAWFDAAGNFWLFGGVGADSTGFVGHLNDLWKFDGTNWTWMKGSKLAEQNGVYGVQGVAAAGNSPGGRSISRGFTDLSGNLWLFGGYGCAGSGAGFMTLNDLWKFDGANWTWVKGSNLGLQPGTYGTQGVAAAANTPGARFIHASARDAAG